MTCSISKHKRQIVWHFGIIFLLICLMECFVFNYRYWESLFFHPIQPFSIYFGNGIEEVGDGNYRISNPEFATIELNGIHEPVHNLYLNLFDSDSDMPFYIPLRLEVTDAANSQYFELPETEIIHSIPESQYIRLHLTGNTEKICIHLLSKEGTTFVLSALRLNSPRPFFFRTWRFFLGLLVSTLLLIFRPCSFLYSMRLNLSSKKQKFMVFSFLLLHLGLFLLIGLVFYDFNWKETGAPVNFAYNYLAESFLSGHTYLDIEPPAILAEITNPYDKLQRLEALEKTGEIYITDFAYRNGHYYCYYGVVPVLLFYLPYQLLTGEWLSTGLLIFAVSSVFIIAVFWLLYELFQKYFSESSLGIYLVFCSVLILSSEVLYAIQVSTIYSLPFLLSLVFDALGLACWLRAGKAGTPIKKSWLIAGSVCIALTVGCRPQLAIAALFAFPIFWQNIKKQEFFSIKGFGNTSSVILPFLIIDSLFLYYNYIRFGNVLDFGATYNLTGFDMTHRSFIPAKFILGAWEYFLQPFSIGAKYPYFSVITNSDWVIVSDYQGQIISEPMLGGFFAFNLIGLFLLFLHPAKQTLKTRGCYGLVVSSVFIGLLMVALDIYIVGITMRYLMDFSFFLILSALLIILALLQCSQKNRTVFHILFRVVLVLSLLCIMTNLITLIASGRFYSLQNTCPAVFFALKYQFFSPFLIR